jgi:hypothetical protein
VVGEDELEGERPAAVVSVAEAGTPAAMRRAGRDLASAP